MITAEENCGVRGIIGKYGGETVNCTPRESNGREAAHMQTLAY
jgi:hypothetical protein